MLYHLDSICVGTAQVESLTSYLKRLAQRHHLSVADLVAFCHGKAPNNDALLTNWTRSNALFWIDGATRMGEIWSQLLVDATFHKKVEYLTMVYWKPIVNSVRLLRERQAWCPRCYSVWLNTGRPIYEPLLWPGSDHPHILLSPTYTHDKKY